MLCCALTLSVCLSLADLHCFHHPGDEGWATEPESLWGRLYTDAGEVAVSGVARSLPGSYETFYQMVRDALRAGGPLPVDPHNAIKTIQVIEAARSSATSGQVVRFEAGA